MAVAEHNQAAGNPSGALFEIITRRYAMKKQVLLALGLALTSPLLLAQTSGSGDKDKQQTQPATPAIPATPASPATDNTAVEGPTTNEEGQTSGSARSGGNSAGATGNPNTKQARTRSRSGNAADFGGLDANHDGKISQDELKANVELSGRFTQADSNSDGALSRAEFAKLQSNGSRERSAGPTGDDTEGSDRTDKDDDVSRKLPGG
jgi:hypothetical protein